MIKCTPRALHRHHCSYASQVEWFLSPIAISVLPVGVLLLMPEDAMKRQVKVCNRDDSPTRSTEHSQKPDLNVCLHWQFTLANHVAAMALLANGTVLTPKQLLGVYAGCYQNSSIT